MATSARSLDSTQLYGAETQHSAKEYDAAAHEAGGGALGGFGLLLRPSVSQRHETQGQSIFAVAKVDKGGPAYTAGIRADDTVESVDGTRIVSWDDAARLLLGGVGTSAAVRWHCASANQQKSARMRRVAASSYDLQILAYQQRQRRRSNRGAAEKGVLKQLSSGMKWLKKQAGQNQSKVREVLAEHSGIFSIGKSSKSSQRGGSDGTHSASTSERGGGSKQSGSVREEVSRASLWSLEDGQGEHKSFVEHVQGMQSHSEGSAKSANRVQRTERANASAKTSSADDPCSPLTHKAVAMWSGETSPGQHSSATASRESAVMKEYLEHSLDVACCSPRVQVVTPSQDAAPHSLETSVRASESEGSLASDAGDSDLEQQGAGWKHKMSKAVGRVVKEVSVVLGAEAKSTPQLSRSTLHGKQAGVGVRLASGDKGAVVIAEVAPWIWAGKHGLAFPLSVGDRVTRVDETRVAGLSPAEAALLLEGEQGTWVRLHLTAPAHDQVDMTLMSIDGSGAKERTFLAGERQRYTVDLMRMHEPAPRGLIPAERMGPGPTHAGTADTKGCVSGFETGSALDRLTKAAIDDDGAGLGPETFGGGRASQPPMPIDPARATALLENAVAGMHFATARMSGLSAHSTENTATAAAEPRRDRGMDSLRERARAMEMLDERPGVDSLPPSRKGRRSRQRTSILSGLKVKGGLLKKMGALCSTSGACGAVADGDVRGLVWDERDEEEFLGEDTCQQDPSTEGKGQGAVARFLQRASHRALNGSSAGGNEGAARIGGGAASRRVARQRSGVHGELSLQAVKSRGSVFRQDSDGIGDNMSFAGFPQDLEEVVQGQELSDYSEDELTEDEDQLARAIADFVAERPHEINLRLGQVVVVLTQHESGWWEGCLASGEGRTGWFPSNHIQLLPRSSLHKKKKEKLATHCAPEVTGAEGEFLPGLDYREASWADDDHAARVDPDKIDWRQSSWAALPRALKEQELHTYDASAAAGGEDGEATVASQTSASDDNNDETMVKDEECATAQVSTGEVTGGGWLQRDLFLKTEASMDSAFKDLTTDPSTNHVKDPMSPSAFDHAVEESMTDGVWRVQVTDVSGDVCTDDEALTEIRDAANAPASVSCVPPILASDRGQSGCVHASVPSCSPCVDIGLGDACWNSRNGLCERSLASVSSETSRDGGAEDATARDDEGVLLEWASGRLREWLVSIDLEMYAEGFQLRSISGSDMAALLHVSHDTADGILIEWGITNKYHRRRVLRKLRSAFNPIPTPEGGGGPVLEMWRAGNALPSQNQIVPKMPNKGHESQQVEESLRPRAAGALSSASVPASSASSSATPGSCDQPGEQMAAIHNAQAGVACCLCEEAAVTHSCQQCEGVLCSHCAESHVRMKRAFKEHTVIALTSRIDGHTFGRP